ncbi:hypothetical protein SAMN04487928_108102 [Butyrivibrio proteoclasticus]|uniref:Dolichyl-phosphate-mannose-protein mannosyltransferase n=1 Tax=Butyrivibrio proteoclasticus TaxID=43305 RepID=A0A1I5TBP5_9FIRM|nr:hypothetical protein [Butyrivibrio proteoclasticus]SFP80077.1 hypothetical protein SAMN04487928_108102 [Butyrivibrio proteoclasticus]
MGKEENRQDIRFVVFFIVFSLVCLCMYGLHRIYGFSLFPDEFGYWASAAKVLGYNFSEVASIGSYYSFGYSLILLPILHLLSDSVLAYRCAVVVNLLLQILSFFILKEIFLKFFLKDKKTVSYVLSGIAVLYPPWVFYVQMTMSEALLFFMFVLVTYLMFRYIEKPGMARGILLALSTVYIYSVHMRTIGVFISVFLMIIFEGIWRFCITTRNWPGYKVIRNVRPYILANAGMIVTITFLIAGFLICTSFKNVITDQLYNSGNINTVYINDYSGQIGKLLELLTIKGFISFLMSITGKLLYFGCATFGLGFIGIYHLLKRVSEKDRFSFFVLMAVSMQFMVMNIYLCRSADFDATRFDLFLHGRYFDFVIPILISLGLYELIKESGGCLKMCLSLLLVVLSGLLSLLAVLMNRTGMRDPHGMLMIGMSYFLDEENVRPAETILFSMIFALLISCIIIAVTHKFKENRNIAIMLVIMIIFVGLSFHACDHFIYRGQSYIYGDLQVADKIDDLRNSGYNGNVVHLYEGGIEYIDTVQFKLRNEKISVEYVEDGSSFDIEALSSNDIVLVDFNSKLKDELSKKYKKNWESGHFDIYYNMVKGEM